jgi:S-formylglutathione hydrolase FrmB
MGRGALQVAHRKAVVVAPQGARDGDTDPEYHNWGPGRNWETALTKELPAVVDARFRTIRSRSGRALIGFSAGGYGASVLGLHHLDEFAVVESWSGYFRATDPSGHFALDVGSPAQNAYASVHTLVRELRGDFLAHPTYFAFYLLRAGETASSPGAHTRTCTAYVSPVPRRSSDFALEGRGGALARPRARPHGAVAAH